MTCTNASRSCSPRSPSHLSRTLAPSDTPTPLDAEEEIALIRKLATYPEVVRGAAATREANILAYNDVFLLISIVAIATLAWMLLHYLWQMCTACRPAMPVQNAQTGMARVSLDNSGAK